MLQRLGNAITVTAGLYLYLVLTGVFAGSMADKSLLVSPTPSNRVNLPQTPSQFNQNFYLAKILGLEE